MLVIIEGPDGSGKTTLVKDLCNNYGYMEIKSVQRDLPNQYDSWFTIIKQLADSDAKYVMDRCYLSEWVYRLTMADKVPNMTLLDMVVLLYLRPNVKIVFCNNNNAYKNACNRGEDYVETRKQHNRITNTYEFLYDTLKTFTTIDVIKYKYSNKSVQKLIDILENTNGQKTNLD